MLYKHKLTLVSKVVLLGLLIFSSWTMQVIGKEQRKSKKHDSTLTKAGKCTLPNGSLAAGVSTEAVLTPSGKEWSFAMKTTGEQSGGMWFINFAKNGQGEPSTLHQFNPPGGWMVTGGEVRSNEKKGTYRLTAKATKRSDPIIVCEVSIVKKK